MVWERLRTMFLGRPEEGESKVGEIAEQKSLSDATLRRVDKLSTEDARLARVVSVTARGIRAARRTGG